MLIKTNCTMIYLTTEEKVALIAAGKWMVKADDIITGSEKRVHMDEIERFIPEDEYRLALTAATVMPYDRMLSIFAEMSVTDCMYVLGFLAHLAAIDGDISREEVRLWQAICRACNMRTDCASDYIEYWKTH